MNSVRRSTLPVALIGAPTDIGAGHRGGAMGPEALRVAGLDAALKQMGLSVDDRGNLSGPVNPDAEAVDGYRHLDETAQWCRTVHDAVLDAFYDEHLPVVMGGDHSLAIGSIAAAADYCAEKQVPLSVIWLDAHADFNTPDTSPSGNIHGMPLAVLCGQGPDRLSAFARISPQLTPENIHQIGIRSVDAVEKRAVLDSGIDVHDMRRIDERGMRQTMDTVLDSIVRRGGRLHVSFDVDFLDPSVAPGVATTVKGGPTYREAQLCMEMISESGLMASLDIMELNPAFDHKNQSAEIAVDLVKSLFGEQILARHSRFQYAS